MKSSNIFEGADDAQQEKWEQELVEKHPAAASHIAESKRRMSGWSKEDGTLIQKELAEIDARLVELIEAGVAPEDLRTQEVIADHFRWVSQFWSPNAESYVGLGDMYNDSPEFLERFNGIHPMLASFQRDAMAHYALNVLINE
ncbi:MAG: TipAS antibiotic-recognition domain-containing protein [Candidatus Nanopelagicales bacterium]|nr:TipAS antibiotic-recognition domain-containing protein [Candidatus Nanopelagicales bacterium]